VWMWQDWPGRVGKTDTGIDLVAQDRVSSEYTAIQRKFYEDQLGPRNFDV
jgi:predicted helicase